MKKITYVVFLFSFLSCHAAENNETEDFKNLFNIISSNKVFSLTLPQLIEKFNGVCKENNLSKIEKLKKGHLECIKAVDAESIFIPDVENHIDHISSIEASFHGVNKCAYMEKTLISLYGKPHERKSVCTMTWRLASAKKGGAKKIVSIESDTKENLVYFSIEQEQGQEP